MFGLARELYGGTPWMMHGQMFAAYSQILLDGREGKHLQLPDQKLNYICLADVTGKNRMQSLQERRSETSSDSSAEKQVIAVTYINGPITKGGGMSSTGMKEIAADLMELDKQDNVIGHVIQIDSGGGSSLGMEVLTHALSSLKKPKVGLVERAGMAASAAYGILSFTDWVMAEDENSEVGSIGTMISFSGFASGEKDFMGAMQITAYATASTAKNLAFREAIETGKTDLVVSELLDPFNERFLSNTKKQRPNILDTQLDGSMYNAGDVVGTMVDQIGSFSEAVNKILELSKSSNTFNKNKNKNQTAMTAAELLAQHPAVHAEIFGAGVAAERDRVETWMVFSAIDAAAVETGIASGKLPSNKEMASFNLKAASAGRLDAVKRDSAGAVLTPEAETTEKVETQDEKDYKALYPKAKFNPSLN